MNEATKKPATDWESIELSYRAGVMSLRQIAAEHGISDTAIRKRAKRDRWERDLSAKIKAKSDALILREAVRGSVRTETVSEREVIEENAQMLANKFLEYRRDVQTAKTLVMNLLNELKGMSESSEIFSQIGSLLRNPGTNADQLNEVYHRVISFPGRVDGMKKLADALKTVIALGRQAFNLTEVPEGEDAADIALWERIRAARLRVIQKA